jgi:hypothetical protein
VKEELQDGFVTEKHVKGSSTRNLGGRERHHGASVLLREPPGRQISAPSDPDRAKTGLSIPASSL